jgi:hypothetical protein
VNIRVKLLLRVGYSAAKARKQFENRKGNFSRWKPISEDIAEEIAECKDLGLPIEN